MQLTRRSILIGSWPVIGAGKIQQLLKSSSLVFSSSCYKDLSTSSSDNRLVFFDPRLMTRVLVMRRALVDELSSFVLYCSCVTVACASVHSNEGFLMHFLLKNYDRTIRPVRQASDRVNVSFGITLQRILNLVSHRLRPWKKQNAVLLFVWSCKSLAVLLRPVDNEKYKMMMCWFIYCIFLAE